MNHKTHSSIICQNWIIPDLKKYQVLEEMCNTKYIIYELF